MSKWTLFSNHGHVLVVLSRDPDARLRDVAQIVGITERAVQKIVRDLQDGGLVGVTKHGRRNRYRLRLNQPLRHTLEAHCTIGELLEMINRHAPGLEPVDEAPAEVTELEPAVMPPPEAQPAPVIEPMPDTQGSTDSRPAASSPKDSGVDDSPEPQEPETPPKPPAPRRRKISPADDGDQGSLF